MKCKCVLYNPNFVGEREEKKNLSCLTTCYIQIKVQILTKKKKKKTHFKAFVYVSYDTYDFTI